MTDNLSKLLEPELNQKSAPESGEITLSKSVDPKLSDSDDKIAVAVAPDESNLEIQDFKTQETLSTPVVSSKILGKRSKPSGASKSKAKQASLVQPTLKEFGSKSLKKDKKKPDQIFKSQEELQRERKNLLKRLRNQKKRDAKVEEKSQESNPSPVVKSQEQLQKERNQNFLRRLTNPKKKDPNVEELSEESDQFQLVEPSFIESKTNLVESRDEILSSLKDLLKAESQIFSFQREAEMRIAQQSVELLKSYEKVLNKRLQDRMKIYSDVLCGKQNSLKEEDSKFENKLS